jgi:hypothetical protein
MKATVFIAYIFFVDVFCSWCRIHILICVGC